MADLLVLPRSAKNLQNSAGLSGKNWSILGLLKRKEVASVPQIEQLASTPEPPFPKEKGTEPSVQSTGSCGGRESRRARAAPWREKGRLEREHEEERVDSTVKEGRLQGGRQIRRASLGEVEGSMNE